MTATKSVRDDSDDISPFWRTFTDPAKQHSYAKFRKSQFTAASCLSYTIFMVFYTLIFIFRYSRAFVCGDRQFGLLFRFVVLFGATFCFIPGWITMYCLYSKIDPDHTLSRLLRVLRLEKKAFLSGLSYVDFSILSHTIFWSLLLIARSLSGPCYEQTVSNQTIDNTSNCNPGFSSGIIPGDTLLALVLGVSSSQALLKGSCWAIILAAWLIQILAVIASCVKLGSLKSSMVPYILFMQLIVLYANENQLLLYYVGLLQQKRFLRDSLDNNSQKKAAEEHTKEIQYLIANTAHDLKTPLQVLEMGSDDIRKRLEALPVVIGESALPLLSKSGTGKESENYLLFEEERAAILETAETVASTVVFMSMTINRVLDFSKVTHNIKLVPSYETISLSVVMAWPASILRSLQGRVSIINDIVPSNISCHIITDKGWLTENLLCLVSNAIKYTSVGSVSVRCYLMENGLRMKTNIPSDTSTAAGDNNTDQSNLNICVEVEDTGIGIPTETRAKLFSPFQQVQRMTTGGTGLGLFSLRKRIEALGGNCGIKDRDDKGEGSCFWFSFPYRPDFESSHEGGTGTPNSGARTVSVSRRGSTDQLSDLGDSLRTLCDQREHGKAGVEDSRLSNALQLIRRQPSDCSVKAKSSNEYLIDNMSSSCSTRDAVPMCVCAGVTSVLLVDDSMSIIKMCSRSLKGEVRIH